MQWEHDLSSYVLPFGNHPANLQLTWHLLVQDFEKYLPLYDLVI